MPFLPRTLFWRTFLLIGLLVLVSTLAWFQIFSYYERGPRVHQIAQTVTSVVNLTRTAIITAQAEKRHELLLQLSEREGIRVYPADDDEEVVAPPPDVLPVQMIISEVRELLGQQTRFAVQRNGVPGFWVSFRIEDDEYWVSLPRERIERQATLQWLGWGSVALLLSLAAAGLIVSRLNRPLKALSRAALEIGRGRQPGPVEEGGPSEVATLTRAFNQMSRDLARLDEDRALILAGVSHDLRTPLSRMRLGIEMSGNDDAMKAGMITDIEEMDRIISQFLDFARTDGGGEAPSLVSIGDMAAEVAGHYRTLGQEVATDIGTTPEVVLRALAMRRVLNNLIDNALRYGGDEVSVMVRADSTDILLEVCDRGPGIAASETERLKQPFTRIETARSGKGGSGLGLAIVDRIVRAHGGRFDLLQREGGGLVARITLPLAGIAESRPAAGDGHAAA
jgi:two-component system osmolarity sensor histidine kinase EnvZ